MENSEHWLPIPGFEDHYEVSDHGRVRSLERAVRSHDDGRVRVFKGHILKPELRSNTGYHVVQLSKVGVRSKRYVHRLVLTTFIGEPTDDQECCHNNDIRTDNRLENLRWDTHQANVHDCIKRNRYRNHNTERTHCRRGHPFDEASRPGGRRICRECRRLKERERYYERGPIKYQPPQNPHITCKRGHPFDEANTIIRANGKRMCRACKHAYEKTWYDTHKVCQNS